MQIRQKVKSDKKMTPVKQNNSTSCAKFKIVVLLSFTALHLAACSHFDRLAKVGETPPLSAIKNPTIQPGYRPVSMPMPAPTPANYSPNSLWRNGARAFFKDQRAKNVGDILTVLVEITDKAEIDNSTERSRTNSENLGLDSIAGYEALLKKLIPKETRDSVDFGNLVDADSQSSSVGKGSVDREEKLTTKMAAVVTQKLPNGNLVIEGRQEIRVNFEVREIIVAGIIRPEDISAVNTIPISKIAEARVSYGGRGQITAVQRPRYGQEVMDILLPF